VTSWRRSPCPSFGSGARVHAAALAALLVFVLGAIVAPTPLFAQNVNSLLHFPPRPPPAARKPPVLRTEFDRDASVAFRTASDRDRDGEELAQRQMA
jgi:hypothetical protein